MTFSQLNRIKQLSDILIILDSDETEAVVSQQEKYN